MAIEVTATAEFYHPIDTYTVGTYENLFRDILYPGKSIKFGTSSTPATEGDAVKTILAVKGSYPLLYGGINNPSIAGKPPYIISDRWLAFNNNPNINYGSENFPVDMFAPFETWVDAMILPGQSFEAMLPGGQNVIYWGHPNRVISSGHYIDGSTPPFYQRSLVRLRVNTGYTAECWINGDYKGSVNFSAAGFKDNPKRAIGLGVNTNSADWDFGWMGFIPRALTDTEANNITIELMKKFNSGSKPSEALLTDILLNKEGGDFVSSFVVENRSGKELKPVEEWDYINRGQVDNFITQAFISDSQIITAEEIEAFLDNYEAANPGWNRSDFSGIKQDIRPVYEDGTKWRYISGVFRAP